MPRYWPSVWRCPNSMSPRRNCSPPLPRRTRCPRRCSPESVTVCPKCTGTSSPQTPTHAGPEHFWRMQWRACRTSSNTAPSRISPSSCSGRAVPSVSAQNTIKTSAPACFTIWTGRRQVMTDPFVILPVGPSGASRHPYSPSVPSHDPTDVVENAVISRLAGNWGRRARVKRPEPALDDLFDPTKADIPEELIPFRDHDRYRELDDEQKNRLRAWGWIAYNKNVIDIEQYVVNPGFSVLSQDAFGTGLGDTLMVATMQAMVDEQYHSLMHLNASTLTRTKRGLPPLENRLPYSLTVRRGRFCTPDRPDFSAEHVIR